ncbi:MAG: hypothetical protein GF398_16505 [Chitinivibrionales bacterium]|nr:hypothetical protein [Chitinivibrionales bacterium]
MKLKKTAMFLLGATAVMTYHCTRHTSPTAQTSHLIIESDAVSTGAANTAPAIEAVADTQVAAYDTLWVSISASDADGDDITYGLKNPPSGAVIDAATGMFTWMPTREHIGESVTIELTADDGTDETSQSFGVEVGKAYVDTCDRLRPIFPAAGEVFAVGDTMEIVWAVDNQTQGGIFRGVRIKFAIDGGAFESGALNDTAGFLDDNTAIYSGNVGKIDWIVTQTLLDEYGMDLPMITSEAAVLIEADYDENYCTNTTPLKAYSSGSFAIVNSSANVHVKARRIQQ